MRKSPPIFCAAKQQCITVGQFYGRRIEDTVNWIRPITLSEDRVICIAGEKRKPCSCLHMSFTGSGIWRKHLGVQEHNLISKCRSCELVILASCISGKAIWNKRVVSAPDLHCGHCSHAHRLISGTKNWCAHIEVHCSHDLMNAVLCCTVNLEKMDKANRDFSRVLISV